MICILIFFFFDVYHHRLIMIGPSPEGYSEGRRGLKKIILIGLYSMILFQHGVSYLEKTDISKSTLEQSNVSVEK